MTEESKSASAEAAQGDPKAPTGLAPGVAAWGLVVFAGCRAIAIFLEAQSMAGAVGQAVLVEWGSSRLGVEWTAAREKTTTQALARRAVAGAAVGFAAAAALVVVLLATRGITLERVASAEVSILAIGFATAGLHAWRDELLLHGIAIRAVGNAMNDVGKALACGVTSAGAALGHGDATPRTVFVSGLLGVVFGALWVRDRGAWQPWAAHTAFRFATGTLMTGGVVHSRLADNAWAGGSAGLLGGTAAAISLAPIAVLAVGWILRGMSPRAPAVG